VSLDCHLVAGAILLRDGMPDPQQAAFAANLAADPDHTVVICDLTEEYSEQAWEPVFKALAATTGSLRLVPWRRHPFGLLSIGELLGGRLARVVVAADGHPVLAAGGALFVPPAAGTGWYRTGPGRLPRRDSRRFPKPRWAAWAPLEDTVALSPATMLRPLPSGAWLAPEGSGPAPENYRASDGRVRDHGRWLYGNVAWSHDTINVVLGQPGAPPVPAADVARLWSTLPVKARQRVLFVPYGTSSPSGQELSDTLGGRVAVAAPLPGATARPATSSLSVPPRTSVPVADAVVADIAVAGAVVTDPPVVGAPVADTTVVGAVVADPSAAGAGTRSPTSPARSERQRPPAIRLESGPPAGSARQRAPVAPPGPAPDAGPPPRVAVGSGDKPAAVRDGEREKEKTEASAVAGPSVARAPDSGPRYVFGPGQATAPVPVPGRATSPSSGLAPAPVIAVSPSPPFNGPAPAATLDGVVLAAAAPTAAAPVAAVPGGGAVRVQPVPSPEASAVYLGGDLEGERRWLQQALSQQFSATASSVARVLSQNPRLRGGGDQDAVADLVAVRLYLTEYGQRTDDNVRAGQVGGHVPFARCVNAGLRRLPSHRGAVRLRAALSDAEWSWYGSQQQVTEWSFCPALTDGTAALPGNVDFLIWSATARRTSSLVPDVPGQVVFLPGTRFKVLAVLDGERREVLLREMPASETVSPATGPAPLDEIALTGLGQASAAWASVKQTANLPGEYTRRFANPPGLLRDPAGEQAT
jgi:hypothetical protein